MLYRIEYLRFLLSITIMLTHYQHFQPFSLPFAKVLNPFYFHGGTAVHAFWAVSGFVLMHVYGSKNNFRFKLFMKHRFARLYPLHFLTLMLMAFLQFVYHFQNKDFFIYKDNDLKTFVSNILLLPVTLTGGESFNAPIWTVSAEIYVYAFFGLTLIFRIKVFLVLFFSAALYLLTDNLPLGQIFLCMYFFFFGVVAYKISSKNKIRIMPIFCAITLLFLIMNFFLNTVLIEGLLYLAILLFMGGLDCRYPLPKDSRKSYFAQKLGELTFTLYLTHIPVQVLLALIFGKNLQDIASNVWFFMMYFSVTLAISKVIFVYYELPTRKILRR